RRGGLRGGLSGGLLHPGSEQRGGRGSAARARAEDPSRAQFPAPRAAPGAPVAFSSPRGISRRRRSREPSTLVYRPPREGRVRHCRTWLALAALLPAAARAQAPFERDDPRARLEAMREWRGQSLEAGWGTLQQARKERDRYGIGVARRSPVQSSMAAAPATAFVNIGPANAAFEDNGGRYFEVDSGRARQIVVDPVHPKVIYFSTAGGGVWKSYDAGQGWEPITDALGTTAIGTLAMDPMDPDILFLGFGDPFEVRHPGILRSGE